MVAGSVTMEIESPIEAKRLWNAMVKDGHNLLQKQAPHMYVSYKILEGDGGVGTIKEAHYTDANKDFSYAKERIDEVDEENFVCLFSHLEGGQLGKSLASCKFKIKFTPKTDGCVFTWTVYYDSLPGITHDQAKEDEFKSKSFSLFKIIEAYLKAYPTSYY